MKFITHLTILTPAMIVLSGCASLFDTESDLTVQAVQDTAANMQVVDISTVSGGAQLTDEQGISQSESHTDGSRENFSRHGALGKPTVYSSVQGAYKGRPLINHIGDYVKNMTQDLISNMEKVSTKTAIGVTHFALLDTDLQQTNLLGQQMAESFVHELHKFRIPVIDFKAADYVRVTENGDFFLTRDYLELATDLPMDFVLTGTMTKHQGGYLVNARILGVRSKVVVASAQTMVPFYVVDALIPSERNSDEISEGISFSQG